MKKIEAIVRPHKVSEVVSGLSDVVYESLAMSNLYAHGFGFGQKRHWMGGTYVEEPRRTKIELLVDDDVVDRVVSIIATRAYTGAVGDGTIAILPVDHLISVAAEGQRVRAK